MQRNPLAQASSLTRYHSATFQSSGTQALGQKPPTLLFAAGKACSQ